MIRGIERRKIFRDNKDRDDFIERLSIILPETDTSCYAWALMSNHTSLTNFTTYYYVVTAENSYGESDESSEVNATPQKAFWASVAAESRHTVALKTDSTLYAGGQNKPKPDPVSIQCQNACEGNSVYGFCSMERKVDDDLKATCKTLAETSQYAKYNVESCPEISCEPQDIDQTCVEGLGGTWEFPLADGGCS